MRLCEYLTWESAQTERSEFFRGEVFAMVGGRRGHGRVLADLMRHLGNHLDSSPCQAFSENMKVQVGDEAVLYPDVFVTCDKNFSRILCRVPGASSSLGLPCLAPSPAPAWWRV